MKAVSTKIFGNGMQFKPLVDGAALYKHQWLCYVSPVITFKNSVLFSWNIFSLSLNK
jgi:hypothetical protein